MDAYLQRVAENILPLSKSQKLKKALREWHFTESIHDHGTPKEDCELCDQEKLRYHFEIENEETKKRIWVGSSCILKFKVRVLDDEGNELDEKGAKRKLNTLRNKMKYDYCISALEELAAAESNSILSNALEYYHKNRYLTPRYAFVVFWRLQENDIDHSSSFFKVALKTNKQKDDLKEMETFKVHRFWGALTSDQKKIVERLGHRAPLGS